MKLTLNCAYCDQAHSFVQRDFKSAQRSLKMFSFKCAACGSTTGVELSTKRERQGAGYKALVAKRQAEHRRKVDSAKVRNLATAERLLSQPGCTCGERIARLGADNAKRMYAEYGHCFSSASSTYGIPNVPHHDMGCPCRNTGDEARIRKLASDEVVPSEGAA